MRGWTSKASALLRNLLRRRQVEEELDEEVRAWFEIVTQRGVDRGLTLEDARRAARLEFETPEQVKQNVREERMGASVDTLLQDFRYAWRVLRKSPGFTFFAVLTIALALGANAAIFSLVDGVLLKSSGYPEPERIVQLWEKPPRGLRNGIAAANYIDWTRQSKSFESMAAVTGATMSYSGGGEPRSLRAALVSAPYFDVYSVKAVLGRTFAKDEDEQGKDKVAVLTHRLWMKQFGGDQALVGRSIRLNGEPYTVIGVLPGGTEFDRSSMDLWLPLAFPPQVARDYHYLGAVARLKRGVTVEQAQAEMSSIAAGIAERYPKEKKGWGATVDRYLDRLVGPQLRLSLQVLMWAVVAVLLIGCANLANLLMARATLRSREIAMRMALGAGRGRVVRMLMTESLLLSALGAVAGIALGYGLWKWIMSLLPPLYLPATADVSMDSRVMLFLGAVTIFTSVAFGLTPALRASRQQAAESLKEGGRSSSSGKGGIIARHAFVGFQVAAAFVLLVGGGLLLRSFDKLMNVDMGFETEGLVAAYLPMTKTEDAEETRLRQYVTRILDEVKSVPGISEVAVATALPLRGWGDGMPFKRPETPEERVGTGFKIISPRYFQALGLRLIAGRLLDERDTAGSPHVVVVNESFVKRYYPEGAIGKRIIVEKILPTRRGLGPATAWEIVGVVADEKGSGLENPTDVGAYASFAQNPVVGLGIVARGSGEGGALIKATEQAVWRVNKDQVLDRAATVTQMKMDSTQSRRLTTALLTGFALLAMLLACAGIYGVLSFVTARRTQELGIRAAMGASQWDLIRMVIGTGAVPVVVGIAIGLGGSLWLGRFIQAMLFATTPMDVPTLIAVSVLFITVALVACLAPALRASRVDPMTALRQE